MTMGELRGKYLEVFGEETRSYHKAFLRKRIAWRLQALAEGGLSERARRRAGELANDADLRLRAPRDQSMPGLGGGAGADDGRSPVALAGPAAAPAGDASGAHLPGLRPGGAGAR